MSQKQTNWIEDIQSVNLAFKSRVDKDKLPVAREKGTAVITCMDPRVNLEAIGIPSFSEKGEGYSSIRIIRTLGAMADYRSLIVGIYLAGIREVMIMMHTDCGCCLANSKIDVIMNNMQSQLSEQSFYAFKAEIGEPFEANLRRYLKTFDNPHDAVVAEIDRIRDLNFIPDDLILHGVVYELSSGNINIVVNGYTTP